MKALVGTFNQKKALVGAFSVIVKTDCGTDGALHSTTPHPPEHGARVLLLLHILVGLVPEVGVQTDQGQLSREGLVVEAACNSNNDITTSHTTARSAEVEPPWTWLKVQ